jgi:hypothetical protein
MLSCGLCVVFSVTAIMLSQNGREIGVFAHDPLAGAAILSAQQYDLVLRGGHVINRGNSIDAIMDVAAAWDRIAAVGPGYRRGFGTSTSESV